MTVSDTQKYQDLQKILDITRIMAAVVSLDKLLSLIVERSLELLNAERGTVFLYEQQTNELVSRIATGADEIRFPADRGIAGAAIQTGETIHVPDAYKDDRFNPEVDKKTGFHTRNILSVPLHDHEQGLVGVLQILNKKDGEFGSYDILLAETLAAQAGVSLQRARLIEHYLQKKEMQRAMAVARDIQQGLLPGQAPRVDGFDIAGFNQPADETGGDTYDFLRLPNGRWILAVADASGHGIGPALVIAETRAVLRAIGLRGGDVSEILASANNLLHHDLDGRFVTCFLSMLDPADASLTFASAGHGPLLFFNAETGEFNQLAATGLPLGIMDFSEYEETERHEFSPGDMAIVTTDGFFEAANPAGEQFGIERVCDLVRENQNLSAAEILDRLHEAVQEFTAGQRQADDLTAILIRKT